MTAISILIADTDAKLLDRCAAELMVRGIYADGVTTAAAALTACKRSRYQLLLLDWSLAQGGLVEAVRALDPNQDIVVLLEPNQRRDSKWSMRNNILDFVVKPYEVDELVVFIDRLEERQMLYESQARLLGENIEYVELQQTYHRALEMIGSLDGEMLAERLVQVFAEVCFAQGVALWMPQSGESHLHLRCVEGNIDSGAAKPLISSELMNKSKLLGRGEPIISNGTTLKDFEECVEGDNLLVPMVRSGEILALIQCFSSQKEKFRQRDLVHAAVLADFGTIGLLHSKQYYQDRRIDKVSTLGVLDKMSLFVEELEREREKSRCYNRSFGLLEFPLQGVLNEVDPSNSARNLKFELQEALRRSLREFDVSCWDDKKSLFCLLPEASFLNCLTMGEKAIRAILVVLNEQGLSHCSRLICFGPAAYPSDGSELDELFVACRRRAKQMLQSPIASSDLLTGAPWAVVDNLLEKGALAGDDSTGLNRSKWWTAAYQDLFSEKFVRAMQAELLLEAERQRLMPGYFFVGQPGVRLGEDILKGLAKIGGGRLKSYLLGSTGSRELGENDNIEELTADSGASLGYEIVLLLTDSTTYVFIGRPHETGGYQGFHTGDWTVVAAMVDLLHRSYRLQTGMV